MYMKLEVPAVPENESFVRTVIAAFCARLDPNLEELNEVKTAVSEAVTNCILHAYEDDSGVINIKAFLDERKVIIEVHDTGRGIKDIEKVREPLYSERPDLERSGMGFTIMENFMDEVTIESMVGEGTSLRMSKTFGKHEENTY